MRYKISVSSVATVAGALIVGCLLGLALSEQPPLDWNKWGVWGQWAGVLATIFVGLVAVSLPRRLADRDRIQRMGPLALLVHDELLRFAQQVVSFVHWLDEKGNRPHILEGKLDRRFSKYRDRWEAEDIYLAELHDDAIVSVKAFQRSLLMRDGYGGEVQATHSNQVNERTCKSLALHALWSLDKAMTRLEQRYDISPNRRGKVFEEMRVLNDEVTGAEERAAPAENSR